MVLGQDVLKQLEKEYPDKASTLKGKTEIEVAEYLAKLELIDYIKLIVEKGKVDG